MTNILFNMASPYLKVLKSSESGPEAHPLNMQDGCTSRWLLLEETWRRFTGLMLCCTLYGAPAVVSCWPLWCVEGQHPEVWVGLWLWGAVALGWWPLDGLGGLLILCLSVKLLYLGADFFSADLLVPPQVGYVVFSMAWGLGLLVLCGVLGANP